MTRFPIHCQIWMDIGRPEFYKKLAVVDPTKSSSTQAAFIMLIQQQMQICVDRIKSELGVEELPEYYRNLAISEGWINGLKLIQKIVANGRYFAESSTRPVSDVSAGNCLAGIAVDFYGSSEAKHLEERSGSKRFRFVMPIGGGAPSPDPIAMFRGAPNPELAKAFIEFIVSLDGQKILYFNVGTDGGPQKSTMRRMPILKTIYDKKYDDLRCDASINPYKSSESFTSHDEWTDPVSSSIGVVIKLAFLDSSDELSDAMGAIINAKKDGRFDDAERAYQVLSEMDDIKKKFVQMLTDPFTTLCQALWYWFENNKLTRPYNFRNATLLHTNYHTDIKNDKKNNMGKEILMAICVGCKFDLRMTQRVLGKAGIPLDEFKEPDKTYITLLERFPGISIDDFNELLKRRNIKELGTVSRKDVEDKSAS